MKPSSEINDKYAANIFDALGSFASHEGLPSPILSVKGETENHTEERIVGDYGRSPKSTRDALIYFYGKGMSSRGNRGGELQFPVSHESHYGAARGSALLFAMKAQDAEAISIMVNVWKSDYAAFVLLSDPSMSNFASPCARLLDGADQRQQLISTMQWLAGKKIRIPQTIAIAPDWLGLNALLRIDAAFKMKEPWAQSWPGIRKEITSATNADILPVKFALTVIKARSGHVAYFDDVAHFSNDSACVWAAMNYNEPSLGIYGVLNPREVPFLNGGKNLRAKLMPIDSRPDFTPNEIEKVFKFPLAK